MRAAAWILLLATTAKAQSPAPAYAPPPPPGYAYPVAPQAPPELPYKEGAPIPVGYHYEERPRKALVITGWILSGVGYGIVLSAAISSDFENQSGWLAVPFAGPWITLGRRNSSCNDSDPNQEGDGTGWECLGDLFLGLGLIMDGMVQAAGGTLLLIGYTNPKTHVIRDGAKVNVQPMSVGSGHGLGVTGSF